MPEPKPEAMAAALRQPTLVGHALGLLIACCLIACCLSASLIASLL